MLNDILEYQKIDSEMVNLENKLSRSTDREKAAEIQQTLKNQHSRLVALENSADKINKTYQAASKKYDEFKAKLAELETQIASADPSKAEFYEKAHKDFVAISAALEKEIATIYADVQQVSKEYEEIIRKSKTDREKFDKFKLAYSKLKSECEPKIQELGQKLAGLEKSLDPALLALYRQKRESHVFPVFVELVASKCGGCRMEISASKLTQMQKNKFGVVECENCGRLNFKK